MSEPGVEVVGETAARAKARTPLDPRRLLGLGAQFSVIGVLIVLLLLTTFLTDGFWNIDNLRNLATQNAPIALASLGMTFVIISGVFDLSIGAIFAAGGVAYASAAGPDGIGLAILVGVLVGAAAGVINGTLVTRFKVDPFISTVGTGSAFTGAVLIYSNSQPVLASTVPGFKQLGLGQVGGVPIAFIVAIAAFLVGGFLLSRTVFGRYVYAAGGNPEAARLAGIPVDRVRIIGYVMVGIGAAVGGMMTASQVGVGQPTIGADTALDAFTIVVIGGTSVYGGRGAVWRTFVGVAILGVLTNFFNFLALDSAYQSLAKGVVLVLAVTIDAARHRRAAS